MRKWGAVLLLTAGTLAQEDLPEKARLSPTSLKYAMRRNYVLPGGVQAAEEPGIRKGRVEKIHVLFFDVDGNGKFNDPGIDGWALNKMAYQLPYEERTLIGASNVTWRIAEDGSVLRYRVEPLPLEPGQRKILVDFNQWRFMNGLPAVRISKELTDACNEHCAYMERHGMTHEQEEGQEGYTPGGANAGKRSCLSEEQPKISVTLFYASFYHRLPLLWPGTRSIGVGKSRRFTAIDALTDRQPRAWSYPIIVPAPNTFGHPTLFAREAPNPIPEGITAGFPITLTFPRGTVVTRARATLRLRRGRKNGPEVPVLVSAPDNPAHKNRPRNRSSICIIPREPLRPMKTYHVSVKWVEDGAEKEREWLFNTGRSGPHPRLR